MGFRKLGLGGVEALVWVDEQISAKVAAAASKPALGILRLLARGGAGRTVTGQRDAAAVTRPLDTTLQPLVERINAIEWYHTIEVAEGITTPGAFDLRPFLAEYKLPQTLADSRVLDVASFDGFWAFEFEKRGAREVVAMDVETFADCDFPPKARAAMTREELELRNTKDGFHLVREVRNSAVKLEYCNVYDLSPARLGKFDFVFSSDLLLHLRDPAKALQNICSVTSGCAYIADCFVPGLPGRTMHYEGGRVRGTWWVFGLRALEQMILDAGFSKVELLNKFKTGGRGQKPWIWHAVFRATP